MNDRRFTMLVTTALTLGAVTALPSLAGDGRDEAPIATALESVDLDVRVFNQHLTTLASPFMEGRVPGSRGMEIATEYVEYHFRQYGLEPPFPSIETTAGGVEVETPRATYRQAFPLSGTLQITRQSLSLDAGGETISFKADTDFKVTGIGGPGDVTADLVFVGYSIDNGPEDYSSYAEGEDLTGKIAVMLRFEPMDEDGKSLWSESGPWSERASFQNKLRAARDRNVAAIILINTPGADDPRADSLDTVRGRSASGCPVVAMTPEAGDRLVRAADRKRRSLMALRNLADESGGTIALGHGEVAIGADMEKKPLMAENVGGLLPGRGDLAHEYIVIGAHLDHLGMGYFGSRSGPGELHPGADDNASGSAGVMLLAEKLVASYKELPADTPARSVVFIGFSAEESGLNGSRYYVDHPAAPIEDHVLMVNFDMIGRITNDRLSVSGVNSAVELEEFARPFFEKSSLEIVVSDSGPGGSDHLSFYRENVPILFGIIADFHGDYHTPADVSWKINRLGAVKTIRLFHELALAAALMPERFTFRPRGSSASRRESGPSLSDIKVRFGIVPGSYDETGEGIDVRDVTEGGSAEEAGLQAGDLLIGWGEERIKGIRHWMTLLTGHNPGDVVEVTVIRDGKEVKLPATLQAKGG